MNAISPQTIREHGLTDEEYERIKGLLGRTPNLVELGIFAVMWSEHCSYKSTRAHLRKLPTAAPHVLQGPGENAGVIDIRDGDAVVFKMESHNHPSFIEPYQGAATGVGGILRDVFTMGARPIAMMNALRFGAPEDPKTRHLVSGVVRGIGGYGNCVGVPTVGGEVNFHASYNGNILVNAMCVGLARADRIFRSAAKGAGNPVVYVGSKTGRDGIHGATMASAEFSENSQEKRPTVQVGDPFTEKLLLEACLELMATDAIVAIQDMGAAGLTSSSSEMASKGGTGIELNLDRVPMREEGMSAYEIMLSESQERMLVILKPGREREAERIFRKWELDFAVIGATTNTGRLVVRHRGEVVADIPAHTLSEEAPVYQRPYQEKKMGFAAVRAQGSDVAGALLELVGSPDLCSRRWVWEQYDYSVMADTVQRPGGDAAVVRVHGTSKGIAISTDVTPRYCKADPCAGAMQAVAECWRNITSVGAQPLAITDNLNFGNPERPEVMGEIVSSIDGIAQACRALAFPVVSGNCSLYNETDGDAILPTPAIGGVGLLADVHKMATIAFKRESDAIVLIGETRGHLGQSLYLREIEGREEGAPPPVDLETEKRNGDFVRALVASGRVDTAHDISDGGFLVAVAEMAMAGGMGAEVVLPRTDTGPVAAAFGEDQGRYIIALPQAETGRLLSEANVLRVPAALVGRTGGSQLGIQNLGHVTLADLVNAHESWFPHYMEGHLPV
jgi:phosphoribosylformylglycinamidine synthase